MTEVVIFGYLGCGNLGDETNLRELIRFLYDVDSFFKLTVITASPESTAKKYQVTAIHRNDFRSIWSALKRADFLIGCGGSLFQDKTSLRSLIYYALLVIGARVYQTRICLYAQGIGPITTPAGKIITRRVLSLSDVITVRDRLSVIALMAMDLGNPEIYFTAEPLLALKTLPQETVDAFWKEQAGMLKLGLIIKDEPGRRDFWKPIVETLKWKQHLELFLIVIAQQDWAYNLQLASSYGAELIRADSWEDCQAIVGGMKMIFSSRLHGLVAAVTQKVPCCGLSTDPKIDGFCLQWDTPLIALDSEVTVCDRMVDLINQALIGEQPSVSQEDFYMSRALENQTVLREFLTQKQ